MGYGRPIISLFAVLLLTGCGSPNPQPVSPEAFYSNRPEAEAPSASNDQRGITPQRDPRIQPPAPNPAPEQPEQPIPKSLQEALKTPVPSDQDVVVPATEPTTIPDVSPTTQSASVSPEFLTLGTVIAQVNSAPIYANKVLRRNADLFRNLAREYDLNRFTTAARKLLVDGRDELIKDEVEYAAADRSLSSEDKQRARSLMLIWRGQQVNQAHGSIELVRRQWLAKGVTFEEAEDDQFRSFMVLLYYQKEIWNNVVVSADEERRYYRAHIDQFTSLPEANIRVIRQNPDSAGGRDVALAHIQDYRKRALAGEDFAQLAHNYSDKPGHDTDDGAWTIHRNTIRLRQVEDAAFAVPPGQISDVIEDGDSFYLIKVESRIDGGVKPFEDEQVQNSIRDSLRRDKFSDLRNAHIYKLETESIVTKSDDQIEIALQMALQNYPHWAMK